MYILWLLLVTLVSGWSNMVVAQATAEEVVRFDITRFQITGNTLLSNAELESLLTPHTGSGRDFGDIQHALEAVESIYHRRGYTTVQVYLPEQELVSGVVHLAVIETRIRNIQVEGNQHFSTENVRASLPPLREGAAPNFQDLSASLRIANENPAKKIALEMQATDQEDQVDAKIKVQDEPPWRVSLNIDNTGTPQSGRIHYGVTLQHANIADLDHVLSLQYTTSSIGPQVSIYGIGYHVPLYRFGDAIDLFGGYSDVASGNINGTPITGRGSVFGARYNQDLGRAEDYTHRLMYGVDYRDYAGIPLSNNTEAVHPVTILPLSIGYTGTWTLPTTTATFSVGAFRNISAGNHGSDGDFLDAIQITRANVMADASYSGVRYNASLNYNLSGNWMLRGALTGQYSSDALISGEQIGLAGSQAVRGFPERDVASDRGGFTNLELYTPDLCAGFFGSNCRLVTFFDHGQGSSVGIDDVSISSVGLGLRLMVGKTLNLEANGAQILDEGGSKQQDDRYLHFQVGVNF